MKSDYFTPYVNDDEKLKVTHPRLVASQWKELVKYWKTETTKGIAEKNKQNHEKMNFTYRKGRTGYASVRYEMEQNGEDTSISNVWIKTHMPKLGVQLDPNTEVVVSELRERLADVPEEEMTQEHMDIIFDDVVGKDKRGRVQTFDLGPSKKDVLKNLHKCLALK
ncbi:hypothetical protein Scep_005031 [Stephania cephalantha]|uniref:Uncharacterized protein n=1 Tax=Stephania cephalantha TaxID=152367 RepID=A0AAP0KTJ1_9MAGN